MTVLWMFHISYLGRLFSLSNFTVMFTNHKPFSCSFLLDFFLLWCLSVLSWDHMASSLTSWSPWLFVSYCMELLIASFSAAWWCSLQTIKLASCNLIIYWYKPYLCDHGMVLLIHAYELHVPVTFKPASHY